MTSCTIDSLLGPLRAVFNTDGALTELFINDARTGAAPPTAPAAKRLAAELDRYFAGETVSFSVPVAPAGTAFQQSVWTALAAIPHGRTLTYTGLAEGMGRVDALRAVAAACGANPVAIVIPCHRVIGKNGSLTGYAGGLDVKARLLELEGSLPPSLLSPARPAPRAR